MTGVIPDGEYDVELSETLLAGLKGTRKKGSSSPDEILALKFDSIPEFLDISKTAELFRDWPSSQKFQLNAESTDSSHKTLLFRGESHTEDKYNCILLFNDKLKVFELHQIDQRLRTTSITIDEADPPPSGRTHDKTTPTPTPTPLSAGPSPASNNTTTDPPKRKKRPKEPSIFQPKRQKTPTTSISSTATPMTKKPTSVNSSDDEVPLGRLKLPSNKPHMISSTKPTAPSPLNPAFDNSASDRKSAILAPPRMSDINGRGTSVVPQPVVVNTPPGSSGSSAPPQSHSTVAGKRPPPLPSVPTPIVLKYSDENEEENDFNSFIDELEEALSDENSLFRIENGSNSTNEITTVPTLRVEGVKNFRSLAGVTNDEDEDLISTSEEE